MAQKKEVKVRDLKPSKDAKGGAARNMAGSTRNANTSRNASTSRNAASRNTSSRTTL